MNSKRAELGFNQLDVFQVDVVVPLKVQGNISKRIEMKMGSTGIREWLATQTSETVGGSEM